MLKKLVSFLTFLRLVNGDGCISLSNIAVIAIITKMCLLPTFDLASAATLLTVLGAYNFKRYHVSKAAKKKDAPESGDLMSTLAELKGDVMKLKLISGMTNGAK